MLSNLNIVKSTNKPKLLDRLEELQRQLNICEKALSDYLETKRLAYPRFYFISSADLLDILSNGKAFLPPPPLSLSLTIKVHFVEACTFYCNRKQSRNGMQAFVQIVRLVGKAPVEN